MREPARAQENGVRRAGSLNGRLRQRAPGLKVRGRAGRIGSKLQVEPSHDRDGSPEYSLRLADHLWADSVSRYHGNLERPTHAAFLPLPACLPQLSFAPSV